MPTEWRVVCNHATKSFSDERSTREYVHLLDGFECDARVQSREVTPWVALATGEQARVVEGEDEATQ